MKPIFTFITLYFLLIQLNAQSITLYGLKGVGDFSNPSTISMDLVQIDPYTAAITPLFNIQNSFAVAAGSSTFDHVNGRFIYWGPDSQNDYRLFSVDVDDEATLLSPLTVERVIELEFDLETGTTYGVIYDDTADAAYFGTVDMDNGLSQSLISIPNLLGVSIGSSTFDSNNKRYIFLGVDNNQKSRLYTLDIQNATVESSPIINDTNEPIINFFEYDNVSDQLLGLYSEVDTSIVDTITGFQQYRKNYLAQIDLATGDATIIGTDPVLEGFTTGVAVGGVAFDQGTGTLIMRTADDSGFQLKLINSNTGAVINSVPSNDVFGEIQVDNLGFATAFYLSSSNDEIEAFRNVEVYPNPTDGIVHVSIPNHSTVVDISVRDVLGRLVYESQLPQGEFVDVIDTDQWQTGHYFIHLGLEDGQGESHKIFKR